MVKTALKGLVSMVFLAVLVLYVEWGSVLAYLEQTDPVPVAMACITLITGQVLSAVRWAWLARGLGLAVRTLRKIELYFLGMFLSLFLPSIIGGDIARAVLLARGRPESGWPATASVLLERVNGVFGLTILVSLCMLLTDIPAAWQALWLSAVLCLWLGKLTYPRWHMRLPGMLKGWKSLPVNQGGFCLAWWKALAVSCVFQALVVQAHVFLGEAVGLEMSWPAYAVMVCLVALASALPISLNGFGVRESGYVGMAAYFGGNAEAAASMAILWVLVLAVAAAPGIVVLWRLGGLRAIRS